MTAKSYNAPWGRRIWLVTGFVCLTAVMAAGVLPLALSGGNAGEQWARWVGPLITLLVVGCSALWVIRGFEITDDAILVRRSLWVNRIPLSGIESAAVDDHACKGAWKTCGNDGLFAMHGRFRSRRLGKFQAYVTNPENAIVLKVNGNAIVISPENPRNFVTELSRRLDRFKETR